MTIHVNNINPDPFNMLHGGIPPHGIKQPPKEPPVEPPVDAAPPAEEPEDVGSSSSSTTESKPEEQLSIFGRAWKWIKDNTLMVVGVITSIALGAAAFYAYKSGYRPFSAKTDVPNNDTAAKTSAQFNQAVNPEKEEPMPDLKLGISNFGGLGQGGNTCYMAGVMQALFTAPDFVETYIENGSGQPLKKKDNETDAEFSVRQSR